MRERETLSTNHTNALLLTFLLATFTLQSSLPYVTETYRDTYFIAKDNLRPPQAIVTRHDYTSSPSDLVNLIVPKEYQSKVYEYSARFGVPIEIIVGIGYAESTWKPWAVSPANTNGTRDLGLFQMNDRYLPYFLESYWNRPETFDVFNGHHNLYVAVQHIAFLLTHFDNDVELAVSAYNRGRGYVARYGAYENYLGRVVDIIVKL